MSWTDHYMAAKRRYFGGKNDKENWKILTAHSGCAYGEEYATGSCLWAVIEGTATWAWSKITGGCNVITVEEMEKNKPVKQEPVRRDCYL